ncbi:YbaB/EbfC family nucleoid-associated protein [Streptomyces sp. CRN 30]|uniref:YbaB/EbfC family nucleoid-associated protein n=1 Tax=Streptomyces sp. CRN 30 TaxID=3075613 RepID=UPI002A81DA37|nr:YbaB/EbfC family nucleoid-associated protein [Streptomyces sp. CRN 30]
MSTPFDEQIEQLQETYRAQLAQVADLQRRMREVTGTATAKAQAMKVTVGPQGELLSVEFPTNAYRRMAPKELADLLVSTVQEARSKATGELAKVLNPHLPDEVEAERLLDGTADVGKLLPADPAMPDAVRAYVEQGRIAHDTGDGPRIAHR